jgi:hypothetical protein
MFMGSDTAAPSGDVCKCVLQLHEWVILEYSLPSQIRQLFLLASSNIPISLCKNILLFKMINGNASLFYSVLSRGDFLPFRYSAAENQSRKGLSNKHKFAQVNIKNRFIVFARLHINFSAFLRHHSRGA